jgi:hypothetical protein
MRLHTLRKAALGVVLVFATIATAAAPAPAAPVTPTRAAAAAECVQKSTIVDGIEFRGRRLCYYGIGANYFPDGTLQIWVVGTDHAVWTRWVTTGGVFSDWVSMGGRVKHGD